MGIHNCKTTEGRMFPAITTWESKDFIVLFRRGEFLCRRFRVRPFELFKALFVSLKKWRDGQRASSDIIARARLDLRTSDVAFGPDFDWNLNGVAALESKAELFACQVR